MIKLINISKKYDNLILLKDFNIDFEKNKITCLFGPSGVGKTTIANIVAGIVPVDEGRVVGIDNSLFSYVFQEPRLLKWYNVYENIDFVLKDVYKPDKRAEIINSYLEMVELSEYRNYKIDALSGGMAQRVSLARAFAYPSHILILDEPFKGLDNKLKGEMSSLFLKMWNLSQRTVIFITHDVEEAVDLSHIIYTLKDRPVNIIDRLIVKNYANNKEEIKNLLLNH
ncbi:MAG TPA: ABC transporter ATP-binding protein [Sedimentibacter sp.]|jgi:NitT/TauT family transport system ATP-binding protein|nr:ABC transporter ATP-binding protein [Sedimentibacter sp.]HOG62336.1 ABC transporter ATP-binding protein [Sedimentibacter sp.]HPB79359.1 ABC transporter ATP-binding protein [Sedimentibacter sp.]HPV84942.1 ABC transporter ATP-binding protein [Sedimentibacter sp.]HPY55770.1 ABC transporter ATP-binding protein [Sedimentibacter sp.]